MVLSVARAGTLLATLVCMTNILYNMVQPLGDSGDPYQWKVRDAHAGVMPQPLLPQSQRAAPEAWPPLMQAGAAAGALMDSNLSGLDGSTHHLDFSALFARERDDLGKRAVVRPGGRTWRRLQHARHQDDGRTRL